MEILRFEQAPADAPKRKKSSRSFLALGLVATLFGVSTAFASSTIQINGPANLVALGQGVAAVLGCDPEVTITPDAGLTTLTATASPSAAPAPTFNLARIIVAGIDTTATNPTTGLGCAGVDFKIQVFHTDNSVPGSKTEKAYSCSELGAAAIGSSTGDLTVITCDSIDSAIYFRVAGTSKANGAVTITLNGSSDIDYITLVSTNYTSYPA
jgi:hypothetical protein